MDEKAMGDVGASEVLEAEKVERGSRRDERNSSWREKYMRGAWLREEGWENF